ncbi:hypothetical protein OESDEN_14797 [Oesophagostomum dentatum]|uniref:Uncharacterized protein n=1 Tax=Oesophagostomum dentatum TaxID=61180 RepID=A0A0B1SQI0_OESDE|nr:hypothetical protein OESDEN_14797 [Oesophagostomum dentatum]
MSLLLYKPCDSTALRFQQLLLLQLRDCLLLPL